MPRRGATDSREVLIGATIDLVRQKGYSATRIDDICTVSGLTKGGLFHYFSSKDELGIAAANVWRENANALLASADYHQHRSAAKRLLGYVDFRKSLIEGEIHEWSCYAGTTLQESYSSHPDVAGAAARAISENIDALVADATAALAEAGRDPAQAREIAAFTQTVIQGAFVVAKAEGGAEMAVSMLDHLRRYFELLFNLSPSEASTA